MYAGIFDMFRNGVDEDAALARQERALLTESYAGYRMICPGHGPVIERNQ